MVAPFDMEPYKAPLLFLGVAGVVVPLFRRLRINPVLGFLVAGMVIGPNVLGRLDAFSPIKAPFLSGEGIAPIAAFGVVFLMFNIGLELSLERLLLMRRWVFGLGSLQVSVCGAALFLAAKLCGLSTPAAVVLGLALALSSTAVTVPVLAEKKRLNITSGRAIFSVLLFQDLLVAPLLFVISLFGDEAEAHANPFWTFAPALLGVALIVGVGRLLLRPLFQLVASAKSTELFMAACLLVVIGAAVTTASAGLSMALGAFIAGLLLAETEYRRAVELAIDPFKGLLLGLFFVSVGASLDPLQVIAHPVTTLGLAARTHRHQGAADRRAVAAVRDQYAAGARHRPAARAGRRIRLSARHRRHRGKNPVAGTRRTGGDRRHPVHGLDPVFRHDHQAPRRCREAR